MMKRFDLFFIIIISEQKLCEIWAMENMFVVKKFFPVFDTVWETHSAIREAYWCICISKKYDLLRAKIIDPTQ